MSKTPTSSKSKKNSSALKAVPKPVPLKTGLNQAKLEKASEAAKRYGQTAIEENQLERFENRTQVRKYTIDFTCPEFTCICPRSGFPDFATIHITYVPHKWCVELKSLKLYINAFRDLHVFHEDVTNVILQDMIDLLDPWEITVVADFKVRGNIHTVVTASHTKEK